MITSRYALLAPFCFLVISACTPGDHLDYVARSLDKWGTVSISGATLIEPDPRFQLDLELSGEEIFRRNRLEGFSNISQFDSLDVQVSVQAEVVANLMDQMSATTEPKLLAQLKTQFMAAAFKGLVGNLPPEQLEALAPFLDPVSKVVDGRVGGVQEDGGVASGADAGSGSLAEAKQSLEQLAGAMRDTNAAKGEYEDALAVYNQLSSDDKKKPEKQAPLSEAWIKVRDGALAATGAAASAAQHARDAANLAQQTVAAAQVKFSQLPDESRVKLADVASRFAPALQVAEAAIRLAQTVTEKASDADKVIQGLTPDVPHEAAGKIDEALGAASPFASEGENADAERSGPLLIAKASDAVAEAVALAALAGVQIAPAKRPQKILEAPKIDRADRLALARLPELRKALANPTIEPELNLRQLLLLTASDKMTLEMLRWLSYPRNSAPNKRVYLCIASVNVVPGKWTYKGYNAQVDLFMEMGFLDRDGSVRVSRPTVEPTVFAVFPFVDSQVLDLRTSRRRVFTTALQLAVNGYPAASRVFLDYARQRQQDVQTLTGLNTLTSYSNGRHLGFTFSPRVVAQEDPTDHNTKPAFTLQPQTFPVVILVVVDEESARDAYDGLRFAHMKSDGGTAFLLHANRESQKATSLVVKSRAGLQAQNTQQARARQQEALQAKWEYTKAMGNAMLAAEELLNQAANTAIPRDRRKVFDQAETEARGKVQDARIQLLTLTSELEKAEAQFRRADDTADKREEVSATLEQLPSPDAQVREAVNAARDVAVQAEIPISPTIPLGERELERHSATHLVWYQTHRWMRAPDYGADAFPFGRILSDLITPRLKETSMRDRARALDRVQEYIKEKIEKTPEYREKVDPRTGPYGERWERAAHASFEHQALRSRMYYLGAHAVGTVTKFALPLFESDRNDLLKDVSVSPKTAWIDEPVTLFITAADAPFQQGYAVSIGGRSVNATRLSDNTLKVVMPPWKDIVDPAELADADGKRQFEADVVVTNGRGVAKAGKVTFRFHRSRAHPGPAGPLGDRAAKFAGGKLVLDPKNTPGIVEIELSRPVAGLTEATIQIPNAGGTPPVLKLAAAVTASGLVRAKDAIEAKGTPVMWMPRAEFAQLAGKTISDVTVLLKLPSGNKLTIKVDGVLIVK